MKMIPRRSTQRYGNLMAIDRLYYFCVTVFTVTFCYTTHYQNWDGRKEGGTVGNIWRYSEEKSKKAAEKKNTEHSSKHRRRKERRSFRHRQATRARELDDFLYARDGAVGEDFLRARDGFIIGESAAAGHGDVGHASEPFPAYPQPAATAYPPYPSSTQWYEPIPRYTSNEGASPRYHHWANSSDARSGDRARSDHGQRRTSERRQRSSRHGGGSSSSYSPNSTDWRHGDTVRSDGSVRRAGSRTPSAGNASDDIELDTYPHSSFEPARDSRNRNDAFERSPTSNRAYVIPQRRSSSGRTQSSVVGRPPIGSDRPASSINTQRNSASVANERFDEYYGPAAPQERRGTTDAIPRDKSVAQVADNVVAATLAGDGASLTNDTENVALDPSSETKPKLGGLHKRRMTISPEKFNTGQFEPMPIKTNMDTAPMKRAKLTTSNTEKVLELMNKKSPSSGTGREPRNYSFSVLTALFKHLEILLHMVSFLNVPSLVSLYSISKAFHYLFNSCPTAFILSLSRVIAPGAERIFPWCNYKSLCINDPSLKTKSKYAGLDKVPEHMLIRDAPSLRWLQMVVWREGVCRDIVIQLTLQGLRVPHPCVDALKRMWFLMDLPLNSHRIALLRNRNYFTNCHIFLLTLFFLKLDMAFTSPTAPLYPRGHSNQFLYPNHLADCTFIGVNLRETLLAERNLSSLWRVLHGWSPDAKYLQTPFSRGDILRLQVRHHFRFPDGLAADSKARNLPILGVPAEEVGMAGMERINKAPGHTAPQYLNAPFVPGPSPSTACTPTPAGRFYPHATPVHINLPTARPAPLPLLRPDQLMMREGIRRCLNLARNWGRMMAWGFVDKFGRPLPKYSEKQLGRIMAGLPPGEDGEGRVEVVEDEVELVDQYGEPIMSVAEILGKV
ncbi:hypothetical protein MBLNU230_g0523t1 [Neophaeotheca triangularis]